MAIEFIKNKGKAVQQKASEPEVEEKPVNSFLAGKLKGKAKIEQVEEQAQVQKEEQAPPPNPVEEVTVSVVEASVETEKFTGKTSTSKTSEKEYLGEVVSTERLANIGMKVGQRINLGDYNSAVFEVSLHYPCKVTELDETYSQVKEWLDNKMESLLAEVTADITP